MRLLFSFALFAVAMAICAAALAQAPPQPPPNVPTTVQLPTFSFFTVQTTVSVPDGGGAYLGGINRGADGSTTRGFGPLRNRGLGSTRSASGMSVHATIIDHHEIDEALLAEAAAKRGTNIADATTLKAATISRNVGRTEPADSVARLREQNAAAAAEKAKEAAEFLAKGEQAEAEGKPGVATIYYQMVIRRDGGSLRQQAQVRLAVLHNSRSSAVAKR
jgi:hypothetical protein